VKHDLKARYYVRYSDDLVLLHEDKEKLLAWKSKIDEFLRSRLRLSLNERRQRIGPLSNGIDFLGYIVRPDHLLARRRVVNRLKARLAGYEKTLIRHKEGCTLLKHDSAVLQELRATWASYHAHLKMANSHWLREALWERFRWLRHFYERVGGGLKRIDDAPVAIRDLKGQYHFLAKNYPDSILLFQVGGFYEFYDRQAEKARRLLGLGATKPRSRFRVQCGFPIRLKEKYRRRAVKLALPVCVVRESESPVSGVKRRRVAEQWVPALGEALSDQQ
jgi:hypothetical protein